MPKIIFVSPDGRRREVQGSKSQSIMQVARNADVDGILAECGGAAACATCHVYIDAQWRDRIPPPDDQESAMLECTVNPDDRSRLSCQIVVTEELDGIVVYLPEKQM